MEFIDGETVDGYMKRNGRAEPGRSIGDHAAGFSRLGGGGESSSWSIGISSPRISCWSMKKAKRW